MWLTHIPKSRQPVGRSQRILNKLQRIDIIGSGCRVAPFLCLQECAGQCVVYECVVVAGQRNRRVSFKRFGEPSFLVQSAHMPGEQANPSHLARAPELRERPMKRYAIVFGVPQGLKLYAWVEACQVHLCGGRLLPWPTSEASTATTQRVISGPYLDGDRACRRSNTDSSYV